MWNRIGWISIQCQVLSREKDLRVGHASQWENSHILFQAMLLYSVNLASDVHLHGYLMRSGFRRRNIPLFTILTSFSHTCVRLSLISEPLLQFEVVFWLCTTVLVMHPMNFMELLQLLLANYYKCYWTQFVCSNWLIIWNVFQSI